MSNISITLSQISATAVQLEHERFEIKVDRPQSKGGSGLGLMGGQYLLIGIGGCFCSTLFAAAQSRNIEINGLKVEIVATPGSDLPKRFTQVTLNITYNYCSEEAEFNKLLKIAEQGCISVNTVKSGLEVNIANKPYSIP